MPSDLDRFRPAGHERTECFHPLVSEGGEGCHLFMSCHALWPERCHLMRYEHSMDWQQAAESLAADLAAANAHLAVLVEEGRRKDSRITSLREQRNYLAKHREPPDDTRLRETISRLRQRLHNTREMFDRQVAVTRCQRAKTGRVGNAAWTARQESVTFEYQTVDQAATILVLEQQIKAANARAAYLATSVDLLVDQNLELRAAWNGVKWMAEKYAEAGESRSIEMEDYEAADAILATDPEVRAGELMTAGEEV